MRLFLIPLLFFSTLILSSSVLADDSHDHCGHDETESISLPLNIEEDLSLMNKPNPKYPQLRISPDYSLLGQDFIEDYIRGELIPPVIDYFQAALKLKRPLKSVLRVPPDVADTCRISSSLVLLEGIETDFILTVLTSSYYNTTFAAESSVCYRSPTGRPLVAKIKFNKVNLPYPNGNHLVHERNIYLAIHEMIHSLGFSRLSFKHYIDEFGNKLTNHFRKVQVNGTERAIIDLEPLTSRLRDHFECPSLPGALLENGGNKRTQNRHFERRLFLYEVMTSGIMHGRRVSEFSLAALEGSGWYMPDYEYAEPFYFGKGQGCEFWEGPVIEDNSTAEFCVEEKSRGCTATGRGGGRCLKDFRSEGYKYYRPRLDYDCENLDAEVNARLKGREAFGSEAGSKCFSGTLSKYKGGGSMTSFCFKYQCKGKGMDRVVQVTIGKKKINCREEGPLKVKGYSGELMCPDPVVYCDTIGKQYCPRNCMGRGSCVNNKCQCDEGYTGVDCSNINVLSRSKGYVINNFLTK